MRIAIQTFGCTANHADSQLMRELLEGAGHTIVSCDAELWIVNTCTVIEHTQRKVMRRLKSLDEAGVPYIVAGCLPAAQPELLSQLSPVGVLTPSSVEDVVRLVGNGIPHPSSHPPTSPHIISIAKGCVGECAYCIVRRARGRLKSIPEERIIREVRRAAGSGVREIQLTAQDVGAYGLDNGGSLAHLLQRVCSVEGEFFVRVGMMSPSSVIPRAEQLARAFAHPKVFKFVHIPVQSGSDEVLRAMSRHYSAEQFEHLCSLFRERLGECTLCTDIIVGYPNESDEDFEQTLELVRRLEPDKLNITRFSARPHTPAAELPQLSEHIKKERSRRLTRLYLSIAEKKQKRMVGRRMRVLVCEHARKGSVVARDAAYRNVVVRGEHPVGDVLDVEVVDSHPMYLVATPL